MAREQVEVSGEYAIYTDTDDQRGLHWIAKTSAPDTKIAAGRLAVVQRAFAAYKAITEGK